MKTNLLNKFRSTNPLIKILLYCILLGISFGISMLVQVILQNIGLNAGAKGVAGAAAFTVFYGGEPIIILLATYLALKVFDDKGLKSIGLKLDKNTIKEVSSGFLLALAIAGTIFAIELALGWIKVNGYIWQYIGVHRALLMLYKAFILCTCTALTEEIFSRGYILQKFEQSRGRLFAVIVSSAIFGLFHMFNANGSWAQYVVPFTHTLYGILFAVLFYIKRSLWMPIGFHFAWNFFTFEFLALSGYGSQRTAFLVTELTGPTFWVGMSKSTLGPEVGLLGVIVTGLALAAIGVYWHQKHRMDKDSSTISG